MAAAASAQSDSPLASLLHSSNNSFFNSSTHNTDDVITGTTSSPSSSATTLGSFFSVALLGLVTFLTISGNLLVMIAILKTKTLRSTQYIFIFCLASTDLSLGIFVLPFATYYETTGSWVFGTVLCNIYVSLDVMLCSASVLHLLFITIDRKLAIKYAIEYRFVVTKPRIALCLVSVWIISIGNSFLPIFLGWNTSDGHVQNTQDPSQCSYSMGNKWYCLLVGLVTFIIPLLVMTVMYVDILHMARVQSKKIREQTMYIAVSSTAGSANTHHQHGGHAGDDKLSVPGSAGATCSNSGAPQDGDHHGSRTFEDRKRSGSVAIQKIKTNFDSIYRENKATVTVFVIFGLFFICWFPYMVLYTFWPLKGDGLDTVNPIALKVFIWTGYVNSTINPFLYTMLNTTFREALRKLLCGARGRRKNNSALLDVQFAGGGGGPANGHTISFSAT